MTAMSNQRICETRSFPSFSSYSSSSLSAGGGRNPEVEFIISRRVRTSTTSRRRSPAISVTCHFHLPGPVGRSAAPLRLDPTSHTAIIRSHADGIAQQDITNAGTRPGARLN